MVSQSKRGIIVRAMLLVAASTTVVQGQRAEVVSEGNAKGIVILAASFPSRGDLHSFGLEVSLDGETFVNAKAGPLRGLRFTGEMIKGAHKTDETILMVPVVARFGLGAEGFLFGKRGTYRLRWDITFRDRTVGDLKIEQTVDVAGPTTADLGFLARIGERHYLTDVLGLNVPEGGDADLLALGMIAELLVHAQDDPGEEAHLEAKPGWADSFVNLAREYSESSYAAYASYFAARIYLQELVSIRALSNITPEARKHPLYAKTEDVLRFTLDHADPFLKPRVLCTLAYLREFAGSWGEAERFLAQAEECLPRQSVITNKVREIHDDIERGRERRRDY